MMNMINFLNIIWLLSVFYSYIVAADQPPQFDDNYIVEGVIHEVLDGMRIPFKAWYDSIKKRSRIDYNNGAVKTYQLPGSKATTLYKIVAADSSIDHDYDSFKCFKNEIKEKVIQPALPDISQFTFVREEKLNYITCKLYTLKRSLNDGRIEFEKIWFSFEKDIVPVRYEFLTYYYNATAQYLLQHRYLEYFSYKENSCIGDEIFKLTTQDCEPDSFEPHENPMQLYVPRKGISDDIHFESFVSKEQKSYESVAQAQEKYRMEVFRRNLRYIDSVNRAGFDYKLGVNRFADRTEEEVKALFPQDSLEYNDEPDECSENLDLSVDHLCDRFDWRDYGAVTPVRHRPGCIGYSYFSVVGAVEGAYFLHTEKLVALSSQALMDCSWSKTNTMGNKGCQANSRIESFKWIRKNKGIPLDNDYRPLTPMEGFCDLKTNITLVARIDKICEIPKNNPTKLINALLKHGPISIEFRANFGSLLLYSSGVYDCENGDGYYESVLIGYGNYQGIPYWLVKFSFGTDWGMAGYIMVSRAANDPCKIFTNPAYYVTF